LGVLGIMEFLMGVLVLESIMNIEPEKMHALIKTSIYKPFPNSTLCSYA